MANDRGIDYLAEAPQGKERERVEALLRETEERSGGARGKPKRKPTPRRVAVNAVFWLLVLALCFAIYTGVQAKRSGEIPSLFGLSLLRIETGSMVPTLPIGSFIIIQKTAEPDEIEAGTIVTFTFESGMVVTHRIIEVLDDPALGRAYRTKGDNPQNDPDPELLTPDRVIGVFRWSITLPAIWGGER